VTVDAAALGNLIAEGETFTVEFKGEEGAPLSDADLVEAVICLANGDGGVLLVGVEDDYRVTGARPRHETGRTDPTRVGSLVASRTQPPVRVSVDLAEVDGMAVLVVEVPDEPHVVGTTGGRYVRRALDVHGRPTCVPFHAHEMLSREIDRGRRDYAALEVPGAHWDDLDPLEFERMRSLVRSNGSRADAALLDLSDLDIARALGVVSGTGEDIGVRVGALLLFGRDAAVREHVPTHEVAFQVLDGTRVVVNEFLRGPLLRVADNLLERFRARNSEEEVPVGLLRIGIPAYPETSFREALANGLVHRDYTRLGAVHVQWHEDRIEISSPGGFPEGVAVENLLSVPPHPRSPILADAFKRAGLVERTGRGVNLIFEGQARYGRALPDYWRSSDTDVVVVIPGGPASLQIARFVAERAREGSELPFDALLVLNELARDREMTTAQAVALLHTTEPDARARLNRLADDGIVDAVGSGRGRRYRLAAGVYRALGEAAAYVRNLGFEPLRQEQMVLQYVDSHGSIARREAMELCGLTGAQASYLLARLVRRGELVATGKQRWTRYERP
jgi:ATP-dependent DNA helicase RecG